MSAVRCCGWGLVMALPNIEGEALTCQTLRVFIAGEMAERFVGGDLSNGQLFNLGRRRFVFPGFPPSTAFVDL